MEESEYFNHYNSEDNHWFFVGQRKILTSIFEKYINQKNLLKIIDAGCGSGRNIIELQEYGEVIGVDNSETALNLCKKRGIKNLVKGEISNLDFEDNSIDIIISIGVFYHKGVNINRTLKEFQRILKKNGKIIIMTPANNIFRSFFLKTFHDISMHTARRHSLNRLVKEMQINCFEIEKKSYYTTILFVPLILYRFISRIKEFFIKDHSSDIKNYKNNFLGNLLKKIMFIEAYLIKKMYLPFGASLIIVAKKK